MRSGGSGLSSSPVKARPESCQAAPAASRSRLRRGPVEELLGCYRGYLLGERGLTEGTARGYVDFVRPFVATRVRGEGLDLAGITAADVTGFVLTACPGRGGGSAKLIVCGLRSLLRWLHLTGQVPTSLAEVVPSVAGWRLSTLAKGLEPDQLRRLLAACDRRTGTGRRDYAVMLLLSRLGLRAGEVARLGLDDIDWRRGEITIAGKGNRAERLPVPADVGAAIAAYLRRGRPRTAQGRSVFVRVHAPHRPLTTGGITMIVFDAAQRAGLAKMHAHRLRHTAATAMMRAVSRTGLARSDGLGCHPTSRRCGDAVLRVVAEQAAGGGGVTDGVKLTAVPEVLRRGASRAEHGAGWDDRGMQ